ncbi:beta-ketoacyl-[acyl-carrier-protein] synthase family protein [Actinosynnema sp. NPDC020468]|uniref:beta-ketoacyl-[acyl-carrier-protein] synthase family protein n=1 Tax=Actinosynnema sp. NPDC020468 TaxID=3154488 RepID=UPI0033D07E1B
MPATDRTRVVVTGIGVISSIGNGRDGYLAGLRAGRCGVGDVTFFDTEGFAHARMHEVRDFVYDEDRTEHGLTTQMTVAAARMAVEDSGYAPSSLRAKRSLVAIGTTDGDARDVDELTADEVRKGLADLDVVRASRFRLGRVPVAVAKEFGLTDVEPIALPDVCAAGNYAIGNAVDAIRSGDVEVALCGGGDTPNRKVFANMYRLGAISPEACRPFDADRSGVVFGEGAAVLVLESLESARARGARVLAEVLDYNLTCDAFHPTRPLRDMVTACLRGALENAGVAPSEVDLVFAHGTGTKANDPMECAAFAEVFGDTPIPPVSGIKSMIGHTMGAAAAHSCVAAILAMEHGFLPPTVNHGVLDPDCPIDCVPNTARPARPRTVLVNALGFGGANAAVVLREYED